MKAKVGWIRVEVYEVDEAFDYWELFWAASPRTPSPYRFLEGKGGGKVMKDIQEWHYLMTPKAFARLNILLGPHPYALLRVWAIQQNLPWKPYLPELEAGVQDDHTA